MDKKGTNTEQDAVAEFMPEEIVIEILLRLPVKSLLRFKTVWYSIINSPEFIKKHLNLARAARYNQHKNFLGLLIPDEYASYPCLMYKEDSDGILHAKEFDFPFKSFDGQGNEIYVRVSNSCDGLICFVTPEDHKILIWNPSLPTEYKIIQSQLILHAGNNVAIGYDPTSDDYKIINVSSKCSFDEVYAEFYTVLVEIFSFKSSSWKIKRITGPKSIATFSSKFLYAKNGIHWVSVMSYSEEVEEEKYRESLNYMNLPSKSPFQPFR